MVYTNPNAFKDLKPNPLGTTSPRCGDCESKPPLCDNCRFGLPQRLRVPINMDSEHLCSTCGHVIMIPLYSVKDEPVETYNIKLCENCGATHYYDYLIRTVK